MDEISSNSWSCKYSTLKSFISRYFSTTSRVSESADWLEWSDWVSPLLENPIKVKDGFAITSDLPGLGLKWNEEKIKELQYF